MVQISIAPITVWPGRKPFFLFSKPDFLTEKNVSKRSSFIMLHPIGSELGDLLILREYIKNLDRNSGQLEFHLLALCVLGERDQAYDFFWALERLVQSREKLRMDVEKTDRKNGEEVIVFKVLESGKSELLFSMAGSEHHN